MRASGSAAPVAVTTVPCSVCPGQAVGRHGAQTPRPRPVVGLRGRGAPRRGYPRPRGQVPGQGEGGHFCTSTGRPAHGTFLAFLQLRRRTRVPALPQLREQGPQAPHSIHAGSAGGDAGRASGTVLPPPRAPRGHGRVSPPREAPSGLPCPASPGSAPHTPAKPFLPAWPLLSQLRRRRAAGGGGRERSRGGGWGAGGCPQGCRGPYLGRGRRCTAAAPRLCPCTSAP